MTENSATPVIYDEYSAVFYGEIPAAQTVLLQGYFEIAEGLGLVRTIDLRLGLVCILTTPMLAAKVAKFIEQLSILPVGTRVQWRSVAEPADRERYLRHDANHGADFK